MPTLTVDTWSASEVADWVAGLGLPICGYSQIFRDKNIPGAKILNFMAADLEFVGVTRVGDQILLHDAIQSLKMEMESDWVTLQSLASQLSVRCKTYRSQLTNLPTNNRSIRIPTTYLSSAVYLLDAGKTLLRWIQLVGTVEYINIGTKLTKYCFELALLSQRDSFADNIIEEVQYLCTKIIEICDDIIKSRDSLMIQPACCDMITIKKRKDQRFGFEFEQSIATNQHLITRIELNSPAFTNNLQVGDEILQVNHRTVLNWDYRKVQGLIRDRTPETTVVLTIKRKPKHGPSMYDELYDRPKTRTTPRSRSKLIARVIEESEPPSGAGLCDTQPEPSTSASARPVSERHELESSTAEFHPRAAALQRRATIIGVNPSREQSRLNAESEPINLGLGSEGGRRIGRQRGARGRPPLDKSKSDSEWLFRFQN